MYAVGLHRVHPQYIQQQQQQKALTRLFTQQRHSRQHSTLTHTRNYVFIGQKCVAELCAPTLNYIIDLMFSLMCIIFSTTTKTRRKKPEKRRERKKHSGCVFLFIWYMRTRHECLATQMLTYIRYVYVHFSHGRWLCLVAGLGNT